MKFLKSTNNDVLVLAMDYITVIKWHLDASFAVNDYMRSHTGSAGKGAIKSVSCQQKINARSSSEAELVSFDDILPKMMWTKLFLEAQGDDVKENVVFHEVRDIWQGQNSISSTSCSGRPALVFSYEDSGLIGDVKALKAVDVIAIYDCVI